MKARSTKAIRSAHTYFNRMDREKTILVYFGVISPDLISNILQMTEAKMDEEEENRKVKKKVFNVMVECLQNVYHHLEQKPEVSPHHPVNLEAGLIMLGKSGSHYYIVTGNYIPLEKVPALRQKLSQVNRLDREGLKSLYRMVLNNESFSDKGTAGLGIIDIARKSGQRICYRFDKTDDEYGFFTLESKIAFSPTFPKEIPGQPETASSALA